VAGSGRRLAALDPAAEVIGNHDLDYGFAEVGNFSETSEFPWLVSNIRAEDGGNIPGTQNGTSTTGTCSHSSGRSTEAQPATHYHGSSPFGASLGIPTPPRSAGSWSPFARWSVVP